LLESIQGFTIATTSRANHIQLHNVPPPRNSGGRSYAPTQPGVKHSGSRQDGYLGNLQQGSRGEVQTTPSFVADTVAPPYVADVVAPSSYMQANDVTPSRNNDLKPRRSYAPTQPWVKNTGSREDGYLGSLQRASRGDAQYTPPYAESTSRTGPSQIVTALLTADGVVNDSSSSILYGARPNMFNFLEAPGGKLPGVTSSVELRNALYAPAIQPATETNELTYNKSADLSVNTRFYLKGDGEERCDESALWTMNRARVDRLPVVATTASTQVSNAIRAIPRARTYAPTQSDVKFKSSITGNSYLEGLNQSQGSYRPPIVSRMTDPFAQPKMAAGAVSQLLHADPRSGESFSQDPFAMSRKAADAVSLLLLKNNEPKDSIFYLA
jgi:hypothetical protein